jgi:hypothetical protein
VVEERAAEGGMKEAVGQDVLPRPTGQRQAGGVVVAEGQALGVAPVGEAVHSATIDLVLLAIVRMDQVARPLIRRHEAGDVEGLVRQIGGKAGVRPNGLHGGVRGLG